MDSNNDFEKINKKFLDKIGVSLPLDSSIKDAFNARLNKLNLSQKQVENILGIEHKSLDAILDRTAKRVDVVNIIKLSRFLDLSLESLLQLYTRDLSPEANEDLEDAKVSSYVVTHFDINNLHRGGFIDQKSDIPKIAERIKQYFSLGSIYEYENYLGMPLFSRTKRSHNDTMRYFWVKSAYQHFIKLGNPNDFRRSELLSLIPKIRPYTKDEKRGLINVINALYNVGVTVIYQPVLPTVQVRGATFVINGKPCVVITDLYKRYPTLWFALLHELYHVLFDYETITDAVYHLSGDNDMYLLLAEEKADEFSREYLFSEDKSKYVKPFIRDQLIVNDFAHSNTVHPSLIYNFYLWDQKHKEGIANAYSSPLRKHIPNSDVATELINSHAFSKETINESVDYINKYVLTV